MRFDIREDLTEVTRALGGMQQGRRVILRATNHAIRRTMTRTVRALAKELPGLKQRSIREAIFQRLATGASLTASLSATGGRIPLIDLAARQTQKGVTYRSASGRARIDSAFISTMRSGHRGVFKRAGKARLPIRELFGPSIPYVFVKDAVMKQIDDTARAEFEREAIRQINLLRTQQGL